MKEREEIMREWGEFLNWCKENDFVAGRGYVLQGYVMLKKRGEL